MNSQRKQSTNGRKNAQKRQLFRFHLGNRLQCKGAKNDKSQNWQIRSRKTNLINELLRESTKDSPAQRIYLPFYIHIAVSKSRGISSFSSFMFFVLQCVCRFLRTRMQK